MSQELALDTAKQEINSGFLEFYELEVGSVPKQADQVTPQTTLGGDGLERSQKPILRTTKKRILAVPPKKLDSLASVFFLYI